ncbi:heat shock cognate 70 kDa protein-like [Silene latifolia]|uniref:heat shock cognate 70 kDa protein-like n=1 Tax=Silene latifolia TaxID=37657 RepID=UPI003D780A50
MTPSCVAFNQQQRFIGEGAINQASMNPTNTIFDAKRLIGRKFNDQVVQDDMKLWPFKVIAQSDANNTKKPVIVVNYKDEEKHFSPEEVSSMILSKMKDIATAYLGTEVKNAVVTVPAYFNNEQRQATKDAGTIAGLNVLRIINEPTAAAISYGLDQKLTSGKVETKKNVLVFDLGGGTFDVSVVAIGKDAFEVKAVSGDTHLGGGDFDKRMVNYFIAEFERKHNKNISNNPRALGRLRAACERAKRNLSSTPETSIEIDCLFDGIDFSTTITRARFEKLNLDLFQNCLVPIDKCLKDAKMEKSEVHEIVLVGGSTRTPMVRQLVQEFFNGKELCQGINPDEAVAYGAACHAAVLTGTMGMKSHVLSDVTPLSLGINLHYGNMRFIVPRNTTIPTKMNDMVYTAYDNQSSVTFWVYEGESLIGDENHYLGEFTLEGIPPAPVGVAKFNTVFEIDSDGILTVSAEELDTRNKNQVIITNHSARLSKQDLVRMVKEAKRYKAHDMSFKEAIEAKNELEKYVNEVRKKVRVHGTNIDKDDKRKLGDAIERTQQWLDWNNVFGEANKFDRKTQLLKKISEPIFKKMRKSDDNVATKIEVVELD